jgi:hypothetical protein
VSNALAIATVTRALAQVVRTAVQSVVPGSDVLTTRPDAAAQTDARVRLFLYQVSPNAALRNSDLPTRAANGTLTSRPTAAIDLHYLLTFYGNETELEPQRMLGAAVRDLHAQPVLLRQMIQDAIAAAPFLSLSNLADAVEQVKFTPLSLSLEELSKLWSVFFQAPYALSAAYVGTVVLIESDETAPGALPVLRRGEDDRGVETQLGPFPFLQAIHVSLPEDLGRRSRLPSLPAAQLGTTLTLTGNNLGGDAVSVQLDHTRLPIGNALVVPPAARSATLVTCPLVDDAAAQTSWAPGLYAVSVVVQRGDQVRTTNQAPLALAPRVTGIAPPNPIARDASGDATLTISCSPQVRPAQRAMLLVGDREVIAQPHPADTATLQFVIQNAPAVNAAIVRLRVDGIDSLPFRRVELPPPPQMAFDDAQRVTIT